MNLEFSRHIFENRLYIKLNRNASNGGRVVPSGRTERHKANSSFFFAILRTTLKMSAGHFPSNTRIFYSRVSKNSQPQWPSGLRWKSADARFPGLRVRIPPEAWISVYCECWVLSGRNLCDVPIPRPGECYRLWRVITLIIIPYVQ
jgi:hypothetical protein